MKIMVRMKIMNRMPVLLVKIKIKRSLMQMLEMKLLD